MKVEFKPVEHIRKGNEEFPDEPVFFIGVYVDDEWCGNVNFVDLPAGKVCRISRPDMGWHTFSKREIVEACNQLAEHYRLGNIK